MLELECTRGWGVDFIMVLLFFKGLMCCYTLCHTVLSDHKSFFAQVLDLVVCCSFRVVMRTRPPILRQIRDQDLKRQGGCFANEVFVGLVANSDCTRCGWCISPSKTATAPSSVYHNYLVGVCEVKQDGMTVVDSVSWVVPGWIISCFWTGCFVSVVMITNNLDHALSCGLEMNSWVLHVWNRDRIVNM